MIFSNGWKIFGIFDTQNPTVELSNSWKVSNGWKFSNRCIRIQNCILFNRWNGSDWLKFLEYTKYTGIKLKFRLIRLKFRLIRLEFQLDPPKRQADLLWKSSKSNQLNCQKYQIRIPTIGKSTDWNSNGWNFPMVGKFQPLEISNGWIVENIG